MEDTLANGMDISNTNILSPMLRERSGFKIYSSPSTPFRQHGNIYSTPASGSPNIYSNPSEPTYQAVDNRLEGSGARYLAGRDQEPAQPNAGYKVSDGLEFLSPSKFVPSPLDDSRFNRSSYRTGAGSGSAWRIAELLCGLMSLVMNSQSALFFPMFLLQYKWEGLLVYLLVLLFIGFPVFIMETLLGSLEMTSSVIVWSYLSPVMSGLGPALATAAAFQAAKTCAVTSYAVVYILNSFARTLPWSDCESWWSPDQRCVPTSQMKHHHRNMSLVCTLYNKAGDACYSHTQPSHVQFWEKYVLKFDLRGLRVLGELGSPNLQLIIISGVLWISLGILVVSLKRQTLKMASAGSITLLTLLFVITCRNFAVENVLGSVRPIFGSSASISWLSDGGCWAQALYLVVAGLSLFQGSVGTFTSQSKGTCNIKLLSVTVVFFHLLYILLVSLAILPLLPNHLNVKELEGEKEIGFFPLALIPLTFDNSLEGKVFCCMVYAAIALSGLNLMFAVCATVVSAFKIRDKKIRILSYWLFISGTGFLLTLPLLYEAGPSILPLYHRYGYELPVLVLGSLVTVLVFWFHGSKRLADRAQGQASALFLRYIWWVNPILMFALVVVHFLYCSSIPEPAPLPPWAFNLGRFFSGLSIAQVVFGILVSAARKVFYGSASTASLKSARSKSDLIEQKKAEAPTYKCFEMF